MIITDKLLPRKSCLKHLFSFLLILCLSSCSDTDNAHTLVIDKQAGSVTVNTSPQIGLLCRFGFIFSCEKSRVSSHRLLSSACTLLRRFSAVSFS